MYLYFQLHAPRSLSSVSSLLGCACSLLCCVSRYKEPTQADDVYAPEMQADSRNYVIEELRDTEESYVMPLQHTHGAHRLWRAVMVVEDGWVGGWVGGWVDVIEELGDTKVSCVVPPQRTCVTRMEGMEGVQGCDDGVGWVCHPWRWWRSWSRVGCRGCSAVE
jgi:hypothetical protein